MSDEWEEDLFEQFVERLDNYLDAKREREKCYESCEYDAGYFCHRQIEREEEAKKALRETFSALVLDTIRANLGSKA